MVKEANPPARDLSGKVAVVTGASRGIGLAIAHGLGAAGCKLVLGSRNRAALDAALKEIKNSGREVLAEVCDVRSPRSVERFFAAVKKKFGGIDILVNNAGVIHAAARIEDMPLDDWNNVIATNLTGLFLCTRSALPLMKSGGSIVNNLSVAAKVTFKGLAAYAA